MSDDAKRAFDRWIMTHADSRNMSVIALFTAGYRAREEEVERLREALWAAKLDIEERSDPCGEPYNTICAALTQDHGETE